MGRLVPEEIRPYLDRDGYRRISTSVETGTGIGKGTRWLADVFAKCITIEKSESLHAIAGMRLAVYPHVTCLLENSLDALPRLAAELSEPVFWYLDAHHTDTDSVEGLVAPLLLELGLLRSRKQPDIIVIDDSHFFGQQRRGMDWRHITHEKVLEAIDPETVLGLSDNGRRLVLYRTDRRDKSTQPGIIVRALWGEGQWARYPIPPYKDTLKAIRNTVAADTWRHEKTMVFSYGAGNAQFLWKQGVQNSRVAEAPIVRWRDSPSTERSPTDGNRVQWGLSMWRHKLDAIAKALRSHDAVIWLDWDCRQIESLPPDFWSRLADGPPYRASLRQYKGPQAGWRTERRSDKRLVPHGAWQYYRADWIDSIIKMHATTCPEKTDEVAAARFLDAYHGEWIGIDKWAELYEPTCYDQGKQWRQVIPCKGPVLFKNVGRF